MDENGHGEAAPTQLEQKIIRQIEYYFSDVNMMRDKFLKEEIKKDNGWVLLKTLLTFNRLKALSDDAVAIIAALRKSKSGLLEIRDEELALRRDPERKIPSLLDADTRGDLNRRTVYAKGFPLDATMDDLLEFLSTYDQERVLMRYDKEKKFKGSVFITFKTEENTKKFLEAEEIKYKDDTPIIERQFRTEYQSKKSKKGNKEADIQAKEEMKKQKEAEEREEVLQKMTKGTVLKVAGFKGHIRVEEIKVFFGQFSEVAWVDYDDGDEFALVRFTTENVAKQAWEKAEKDGKDGIVTFGETEAVLTASVMEGEEEEEHWIKMFESINRRSREIRENRYRGNRGGRGGRGNRGGRGGHRGDRGGFKRSHRGEEEAGGKMKKESEPTVGDGQTGGNIKKETQPVSV